MEKNSKVILLYYPMIEKGEVFPNIPWAMLYLERMVRDLNVEVVMMDERLVKDSATVITKYKDRILFAGVSVMIGHQITGAVAFTETFRGISDRPVLWGGWFPTVVPEMILKDGYADYVCIGQGEVPFRNFTIKQLQGKMAEIEDGISFMANGNPVISENKGFLNPDNFGKTDLSRIDINALIEINGRDPSGRRSVDYMATSGCPYACRFCNAVHLFGRKWYPKSVDDIINDIRFLINSAGVNHIDFRDDNFFGNRKFILSFCRQLIESGISITWESNVHLGFLIKNFSDADMELFYQSGCRMLRIGAESGDQEVLDLIRKEIKVEDIYAAVKFMKRHQIKTRFLTMSCFPLNPRQDFRKTVILIGRSLLINPELDPRLRFFVPVPKTELYELCVEKGFVLPDSTREMMDFFTECFTMHYIAPWNSRKYLRFLSDYVRFYFNWVRTGHYKRFPGKMKPFVFALNMILYPIIALRFKTGWLNFTFEARLFGWLEKYRIN